MTPDPQHTIPFERLPEGFAEGVDDPPDEPAPARPAATVALIRRGPGRTGLEVLLLRRVRSSGFVPGAWVFPGGRVDPDDATDALVDRTEGLDPPQAAGRLALPPEASPPAIAYYVACLREAFEETGILVARTLGGAPAPAVADDPAVAGHREALLEDPTAFAAVLDRLGCRLDGGAVAYIAHWITPVAEPRRYDTRFFAARVGRDREVVLNRRELSDALWVSPREALARNEAGELPMVFPTVRTLEALADFEGPDEVIDAYRDRPVPTILPRLVRTPTGVGIEVD